MTWCENNGIDYIFGLSGTKPLAQKSRRDRRRHPHARRATENLPVLRGYTETRHQAKSCRIAANGAPSPVLRRATLGLDIRFVVTSLDVALGRVDLRQPVLRAAFRLRSDQAAQDAARLRSHQLPFGARQSSPPRSPHRRLLVDADRARRHSQSPGIGHCRVCNAASSPLENRCPAVVETTSRGHSPPAVRRCCRPGSRPLPQLARRAAAARSLTGGASAHFIRPIPQARCKVPIVRR